MIELAWDAAFKRSYKKRVGRDAHLRKRFRAALGLFTSDSFDARLRTHKLTGKLSGCWAFSVDHDCRVVFIFIKGRSRVLLVDIGSHDEVY